MLPSPPLSFTKAQRLLNAADFKLVFDQCCYRVSHKHCLILAVDNQYELGRLGIVVAKKNIKLAVNRNRVKRLIRESFRQQQHHLVGIDAIVLARRGLDQLDNADIHTTFETLWQKISKKAKKD